MIRLMRLCTALYRVGVLALLALIASELASTASTAKLTAGIFLILYKVLGGPTT